ncbi:hypothetical protein WR25_05615 isoform C [Diploscapter pachys]|uniref:Vang-like protein n=1 Tax=Diploscapter pachys TaxID=2018661 RepID=A0A2A2JRB4_9BILA|nr:hypothetical protein WR25_05615 isoform C [Diploscapter pachys]
MSVVSAGGRLPMPRDQRGSLRMEPRHMRARGRYAHSDVGVGDPFLPRFSAIASEGVKIPMQRDEWGEDTTVVTGVTSEHSYSGEEKKVYEPPVGRVVGRRSIDTNLIQIKISFFRCSRLFWILCSSLIGLAAVISAPAMCILPFLASHILGGEQFPISCQVDCQGSLLLVVIKTILLIVAIWALYWRHSLADMPRLYVARVSLVMFVLFILFAFWLFYIVRIFIERYQQYTYVISFATSLLDALLFIHYISFIILEIRRLRKEFVVTIVRDPDGESRTMPLGYMSIQEAAVEILLFYESTFPSYNMLLDKARQSAQQMRSGVPGGAAGFKMYDLEGLGPNQPISEVNARALMEAAARRRIAGYNELIQEEMDFSRRLQKRKYRLKIAAEDAFAHMQGIADSQQGTANGKQNVANQMDSMTAAQNVFTWIMRPMNKYLKTMRMQQKFNSESITRHIEKCLSMKVDHRTFLQRYFSDRFPEKDIVTESKWSIVSDSQSSANIQHGITFLLRSHNKADNNGVQLLCTVSTLPFINLTEQSRASISKFALKISNESSV